MCLLVMLFNLALLALIIIHRYLFVDKPQARCYRVS